MKLSLALALIAVSAPLVAHAQTADLPDEPVAETPMLAPLPMAPKTAATADAFVWRFAPPVGSRWTMRSFTRATSAVQTPAMGDQKAESFKFIAIQKMTADYDVLSRDKLGATTIRMTIREMTSDMSSTSNGKVVNLPLNKSADPKSANGATLTIKQSRDGKVWGIVGMRAFQRKIMEASGALDGADLEKFLDANPMTADNEMIKSLSQVSGGFPTSPVRVGESWDYDMSLPAQMSIALDINGTRTLKKLDAGDALISETARMNGGNSPQKLPGAANTPAVDMSRLVGTVNGTTRVQRSSGLPLETTMNLTLSGSISTQVPASNGAKAKTVTVPMDVTTATRVVMEPR